MIQTLGDVFLLVAIISVGLVSFLLAVFLYHLIFVMMDLRQVMKRLSDLTAEVENMLMRPVEIVAQVMDWLQKYVWDLYMGEEPKKINSKPKKDKKRKGKKKRKKGEFKAKKV